MAATKADLRKGAIGKRAAITDADRAAFAARLATLGPRLLLDFAPGNAALVVSLYCPIGSEANVMPLAETLHAAGVPLAMPVAVTHGSPLVFRAWHPGSPVAMGPLGIREPLPDAATLEPDVLFVPLAAFDRRGHRIGYGAGPYDASLAALRRRKTIRAIGVGFSVQEVLFVPSEPHDEPMDMIVTDRDTLICGT